MLSSNSHSSVGAQLPQNTHIQRHVTFRPRNAFPRLYSFCSFLTVVAILGLTLASLDAADDATAETGPARWAVFGAQRNTRVEQSPAIHDGEAVQRFRLLNTRLPEDIQIRTRVPASMVHNDYAASVSIHSSVIGIQLGLLLVLPNQTDPRTGKPLELILPGEKLTAADQWQTLHVQATKKAIEAQIRRVRAELNSSDIRMQQAIITDLVLFAEATPGEVFFDLGVVSSGPTIAPDKSVIKLVSESSPESISSENESRFIPVDVELGGLMLDINLSS
jgi:hypothetical protein